MAKAALFFNLQWKLKPYVPVVTYLVTCVVTYLVTYLVTYAVTYVVSYYGCTCRKLISLLYSLSPASNSSWVVHFSPIFSVTRSLRLGLHRTNQRLGVIPAEGGF